MKTLLYALMIMLMMAVTGCTQTNNITFTWTTSGDGNSSGTATSYEFQRSTDSLFSTFEVIPNPPTPLVFGTEMLFLTTQQLESETIYYFRMKTCDEIPNCSIWSNTLFILTPDNTSPNVTLTLRFQ